MTSSRFKQLINNCRYVLINKYWDRTSKCLICLVDAGLNWYFLHTVRVRLVNYYGLVKYAPLVSFNAKLMVVSVTLDVCKFLTLSPHRETTYVESTLLADKSLTKCFFV